MRHIALSELEGQYLINRYGTMFCIIPKEVVDQIRLLNSLGLVTEVSIIALVERGYRNSVNRLSVGTTGNYLFYLKSINGPVMYYIEGKEVDRSTWEFKVRKYDA